MPIEAPAWLHEGWHDGISGAINLTSTSKKVATKWRRMRHRLRWQYRRPMSTGHYNYQDATPSSFSRRWPGLLLVIVTHRAEVM